MLKKALVILGVLALFLIACGGGNGDSKSGENDRATPQATVKAERTRVPTAVEPTRVPTETSDGRGGALEDVFQPLSLMGGGPLLGGGGLDLQGATTEVDPDLKAALIRQEDLPAGYTGLGNEISFTFAFDSAEGHMEMAATMFMKGDITSGQSDGMVMSAVIAMPPAAIDEFYCGMDELKGQQITPENLEGLMGGAGMGWEFKEYEFYEVPGLGDKGFRMHMVMDLSGFAGGSEPGMEMFEGGISYDMVVFGKGQRLYMVMNVWPAADLLSDVDAEALAELMNWRAG